MKNRSIKTFYAVWIVLIFMSIVTNAQNLTAIQTDRLFKAGQLWGHITYFHPYLQYKKIAFDSAYAASVPEILAAQSDEDFSNALNSWLSILNELILMQSLNLKLNQRVRLKQISQ
ncbi:MAG: hypothetical protein IPP01_07395 [Saprospiraceae bacterium]|nr:hypothetical protein [Saprospiraceae bacterium]